MANKDQENEKANDNQTRDLRYAEDSEGLAKTSDFRRSLAVIIGIDDYQRGVPPLKTAVNDARRLAEVLDEDYALTGSRDGTARLWDTDY